MDGHTVSGSTSPSSPPFGRHTPLTTHGLPRHPSQKGFTAHHPSVSSTSGSITLPGGSLRNAGGLVPETPGHSSVFRPIGTLRSDSIESSPISPQSNVFSISERTLYSQPSSRATSIAPSSPGFENSNQQPLSYESVVYPVIPSPSATGRTLSDPSPSPYGPSRSPRAPPVTRTISKTRSLRSLRSTKSPVGSPVAPPFAVPPTPIDPTPAPLPLSEISPRYFPSPQPQSPPHFQRSPRPEQRAALNSHRLSTRSLSPSREKEPNHYRKKVERTHVPAPIRVDLPIPRPTPEQLEREGKSGQRTPADQGSVGGQKTPIFARLGMRIKGTLSRVSEKIDREKGEKEKEKTLVAPVKLKKIEKVEVVHWTEA
ncbi:hypothetical protein K402DRAFT_401231 [Aulographum hederae CBS 113979]|uniref:Uncharacterized protein n=1 Tax=Aulographum hederae CBS 113979 TaxID=1176131 RepID=A0A6G1HBR4_9PEZI|nr:hypothetical protein K402DRAFT_401231 [Aulographum hederae CBS 113979]